MPVYEYACNDKECKGTHSSTVAIKDYLVNDFPNCPDCNGPMHRIFSATVNRENLRDH